MSRFTKGFLGQRGPRLSAAILASCVALGGVSGVASADNVDKISKDLVSQQGEIRRMAQGISAPSAVGKQRRTMDAASRKLIDAQVQFGLRNWDDAALMLYDFVERFPNHRSYDEALYYLGESLFQKNDNHAARTYFKRLVVDVGASSKFYAQGLERLVELSLRLQDPTGIQDYLQSLDSLPASKRPASVPYVRGKYAYFSGQHDEAIRFFRQVPVTSKYSFQAQYFLGASYVAKGDLPNAVSTYNKLVTREAKTENDRRVSQLANMALGRLHYERDQPSQAIDRYLEIDRKSDLFDDVLYEVAWVYVKNKEYPKALRALELLQLTDPLSSRMPEVRILEGNLRIRKAQSIGEEGVGNAAEEYSKAEKVFSETNAAYKDPQAKLEELLAAQSDTSQFLAQISGRETKTFETQGTLPEVAAAWLREEPDVQRVVAVETDLGQIESDIADAERNILRIELAINSSSRVDIFPELAERRYRAIEIREDINKKRETLLAELRKRVGSNAEADRQVQERQRIRGELGILGDTDTKYRDRVKNARNRYIELDQEAAKLRIVVENTEAQIAALEQFIAGMNAKEKPANSAEIVAELETEKKSVATLREELERLTNDARAARDTAGAEDESVKREAELRAQLSKSLDDEARALTPGVAQLSGKKRSKADQILNLLATAQGVLQEIDRVNAKIDMVVDSALVEVRQTLEKERSSLAAYKQEFVTYDGESRGLGGEVLTAAFADVSAKFRDVLMRSDIGLVDVAWSHKETNESLRRRLAFDQARERKTLNTEFADVVEEIRRRDAEAQAAKLTGGSK